MSNLTAEEIKAQLQEQIIAAEEYSQQLHEQWREAFARLDELRKFQRTIDPP